MNEKQRQKLKNTLLSDKLALLDGETGCRIWTGALSHGVPVMSVNGRNRSARSVVAEVFLDMDECARKQFTTKCMRKLCIAPAHIINKGIDGSLAKQICSKWLQSGSITDTARYFGLSRPTIYRIINPFIEFLTYNKHSEDREGLLNIFIQKTYLK